MSAATALPAVSPLPAPGSRLVPRPRLVRPFVAGRPRVALVLAPAGYGKTRLVEQWCAHDPRPVRARLDELAPARPGLLVVDASGAWPPPEQVDALVRRVPAGSTLVLAGRSRPPLRLGRLRAEEDVLALGAADLALTAAEVAAVLRLDGVLLDHARVLRLRTLTEGWPAAVRLCARLVRRARDPAAALDALRADDEELAGYVREEVLAGLHADDQAFLRSVSVLSSLDARTCDALLGTPGSGTRLRRLAAANALVLPEDRAARSFRLHPLLAATLRADLRATEPGLERRLHARAARWFGSLHDDERALEHAVAGHEAARAARLLASVALTHLGTGRTAPVARRLDGLGERDVAARPELAALAAWCRVVAGDLDGAERWLPAAAAAGSGPSAWLLRAALGRGDLTAMRDDAERALAELERPGVPRAAACLLAGVARTLAGEAEGGRALLAEGVRAAGAAGPLVRGACLAVEALTDVADGALDAAAAKASRARALCGPDAGPRHGGTALTLAVAALVTARTGDVERAREDVDEARAALRAMHGPPPWYAACVTLAAALAHLRLSDGRTARVLLREASLHAGELPDAVALRAWLDGAWAAVDAFALDAVSTPSPLTLAELRILRFLPTHLSVREIAARLHVTSNTVKTQTQSVYRKLGVASRSAAVDRAREVGLVDP